MKIGRDSESKIFLDLKGSELEIGKKKIVHPVQQTSADDISNGKENKVLCLTDLIAYLLLITEFYLDEKYFQYLSRNALCSILEGCVTF